MRLYHISCDRCGWKAPLPVEETVKDEFLRKNPYCLGCLKAHGVKHKRTVREVIAVGVTPYFPHRDRKDAK